MAVAIPLTTTTNTYIDPGAAVFDFGGTPFQAGYLYVQNASAYVSLRVGNSLGNADWQTELPYSPTLIPLLAGDATPWRRNTGPDLIYGVRARSLMPGTPAVVYGGAFQPGEATSLPSNQLAGTITPGGGIVPPVSGINGVTGIISGAGAIVSGTGFTVVHIGSGRYGITYSSPFSQAPVVLSTSLVDISTGVNAGTSLPGSVEIDSFDSTGTLMDGAFNFAAIAIQ